MKKILASNFYNYHKVDGVKIPNKFDNSNKIIDCILENLQDNKTILFIPSDPKNKDIIKEYSYLFFEGLRLSGVSFKNYIILDEDNKKDIKKYVNEADMIFLSGGDTPIQMEFLNSLNFKNLLIDYDGLILGQSAGALNMSKDVYNSPEGINEKSLIYFKGLGLVDFNIEPHFVLDDSNFNIDELYQRKNIIEESYKRDIIGLCDGSHILVDGDNIFISGESYFISKGKIEPINIKHKYIKNK